MTIKVISCIGLFRRLFGVPFYTFRHSITAHNVSFCPRTERGFMTKKTKESRMHKINKAVKANDWNEVSRLLQQEQNNAERRDRYYHKQSLDENVSYNDGKQRERYEMIASSDLTPEEALYQKELHKAKDKAKEKLSLIDRVIVEMVAEQEASYSATARHISKCYKKMSDVTVKAHYVKALKKLASLLEDYR